MTASPLIQLRAFLTGFSAQPEPIQSAFVRLMNAGPQTSAFEGTDMSSIQETARATAESFWGGDGTTAPSGPLAFWIRWEGISKNSGIGVLLQSPRSRFLLLPRQTDPLALRLDKSIADPIIDLVPNVVTLSRYRSPKLSYARIAALHLSRDITSQTRPYKEFAKNDYTPAVRNLPMARPSTAGGSLELDDYSEGPYRAIAAAQLGAQFLLCQIAQTPGDPRPTVELGGVLFSFPSIYDIRPSIVTSAAIPPSRYFGGSHPEFSEVPLEVSGAMDLFDRQGIAVGEAQMLAGGAEGLIEFPQFHLCAKTSEANSSNQEDGCYIAHFQLPGLPRCLVMAGFDGLGGAPMGELAQSAASQGVHAGLVGAVADKRIPYPHELMESAARAADAQVRFLEEARQERYQEGYRPDAVGCIAVVVGRLILLATDGDFIALVSERKPDGRIETVAYTNADATSDYAVRSTVRTRNGSCHAIHVNPESWVMICSDGVNQNILGDFKNRTSRELRAHLREALPDQGMFYNLNYILSQTPTSRVAKTLHDIALDGLNVPGYPHLRLPKSYGDNLTAMTLFIPADAPDVPFEIPNDYLPLDPVMKPQQFYYDAPPSQIYLPKAVTEIFVGKSEHPEGLPMLVMADSEMAPLHARIFQQTGNYFVELLDGDSGLSVKSETAEVRLQEKGETAPLQSGAALVLSPETRLELHFDDSGSNKPTIRPT